MEAAAPGFTAPRTSPLEGAEQVQRLRVGEGEDLRDDRPRRAAPQV
jgi:hypothetical protein